MENSFLTKMQRQNTLLNIETGNRADEEFNSFYIHEAMKAEDVSKFEYYIGLYLTTHSINKSISDCFHQSTFEKLFNFLLSNQNTNLPMTSYKFIKRIMKEVKFDVNIYKILENEQHYFTKMKEYLENIGEDASYDPLAIGICKIVSYIAQFNIYMNVFITTLFPLDFIYNTMNQNPQCISFYLYSVSKCNLSQEVFECTVNILKVVQNLSEKWIKRLLDTITLYITPQVYNDVQDHVEFVNLFIISYLHDPFYDSVCRLAREFFSMFNQDPNITCNEKFDISELVSPIFDRICYIFQNSESEVNLNDQQKVTEKYQKVTKKSGEEKVEVLNPIPPLEALHEIILFVKTFPDDFAVNYLKLFNTPFMHDFRQLTVKEIYVRLIVIIVSFSPDKIELILQKPDLMQYFSNLLESDQPEYALELFCLIHNYFKLQSRKDDIENLVNNLDDYRDIISDCIDSPNPKIREFASQLDSLFIQE